jgi:hypothetical protein
MVSAPVSFTSISRFESLQTSYPGGGFSQSRKANELIFLYTFLRFRVFVKYIPIQLKKEFYVNSETEVLLLLSKNLSFDRILSNSNQFSSSYICKYLHA